MGIRNSVFPTFVCILMKSEENRGAGIRIVGVVLLKKKHFLIAPSQTVEHNRPTPRSIDVSDAENLDTLQRPGAMTRGENSISALITKQPTALKVATILFWTVTKTDQLFVRCNLHFSSQSTRVGKRDELLRSDISRLLSSHIFSWMQ